MTIQAFSEIIENKKLYPISSKINEHNHLVIGDCDVVDIVNKFGTPLYIIDEKTLVENCRAYTDSLKKYYEDFLVLYASKAFCSPAILKIINSLDIGLDVVSGGEFFLALKAEFNLKNIFFHGNNKTPDEIKFAIEKNIGFIVCDNFTELELVQEISKSLNKKTEILIRLTPGIECHTHEYIKTGHIDSKFGFTLESYNDVLNYIKSKGENLILKGLHAHIGSQIFELKPFSDTIDILLEHFIFAKKNYGFEFSHLNIGGGIGISYTNEDDPFLIDDWAKTVSNTIKEKCKKNNLSLPKLICEPGRSLIGPAGVTLYKVGNIKNVPDIRKYVSVDGGMADNPRPITYQAKYVAAIANKINDKTNLEKVTIAGRYCETGDILIKDIELPKINIGDIIVVLNTGAYNYSMSSNYNMVPKPACVIVKNGKAEIIIERESYEDLILKHRIISV